jgi:hypothetical protein
MLERKGYYGGYEVWVREFGQSINSQRALSLVRFAEVLR